MKRVRLTEKHPFMQRVFKAFEAMESEGVRVRIDRNQLTIIDTKENVEYELLDLEGGDQNWPSPFDVPPTYDFRVVTSAPEDPNG